MLECVINISEGRDASALQKLDAAVADHLAVMPVSDAADQGVLDIHTDPHHHRSVFTVMGEDAARALARASVDTLDISVHSGVHPRIGVVDVVPFVPLAGSTMKDAIEARDRFASWIADELSVPAFLYGPERTLPDIRRHAFAELAADVGPTKPHPTAGAVAVGARAPLVAWNVYLAEPNLAEAKRIAATVRQPALRALGLQVGDTVQVSMNLVDPERLGPAEAFDLVAEHADIASAELVGLVPQAVLERVPQERWPGLDLDPDRTIEARLRSLMMPR